MDKKKYMLSVLQTLVLSAFLVAAVLVRTFLPRFIMPGFEGTNLVLLSLIALTVEAYLAPEGKRSWIWVPVLSVVSFAVLPLAAGFVGALDALILAAKGGVVFTVTTWLYDALTDRMSTGPVAKAAPLFSALGLYLAAQCLMGIL